MSAHLLQVLPSVIRGNAGAFECESDFGESLRLYAENFDSITVACPVASEVEGAGQRYRSLRDFSFRDKIRIAPLPYAYGLPAFLRHFAATRRLLRAEIANADFLLFSPHAMMGDWPSVAVRAAIDLGRSYVIDADVVYEEVARVDWRHSPAARRFVKQRIVAPLARRRYRRSLQHASLALLQGQDVFEAYAPYAANPQKTLHTPVSPEDQITDAEVSEKLASLARGRPLRLCYVGRCIEMKGPLDWLNVMRSLADRGVSFKASWLGDGAMLADVRAAAKNLGLDELVEFRGYVSDRNVVLEELRDSDLFVFCHQTPESPRCLVEALVSACPLVGYGSGYPRQLVAEKGGGEFAAVGDWRGLASRLADLATDRPRIRDLIGAARASGRLYDRDVAMQRRIDLIRKFCGPRQSLPTLGAGPSLGSTVVEAN